MDTVALLPTLLSTSLFSGLDPAQVAAFLKEARCRLSSFPRGAILLSQGDSVTAAGVLLSGKIKAYLHLCLAMSAQALNTKAASATRPVTDNPKYTFRCWLLRLGFIGDEFETARTHLLANLPGNAAWRQAS